MLPVETCWSELASSIDNQDVILVAPPGAGKSTYLPLKLLALPIFKDRKIIMLQPRQVAVRAIAQYLAQQLDEPVGRTIGYRMRGESKVSSATRLEIVTEGLLTRLIQTDPELNGIGLIIFDEFHERNIHADFSLALSLEIQQGFREDLRLLIMSATLNVAKLESFLPNAKRLESSGRSFPITLHYRPAERLSNLVQHACMVTLEALEKHQGNVLIFMSGAKDIQSLAALLKSRIVSEIALYPLYGDMSKEQQNKALAPTSIGQRKIVIATNIAETSLTIDGISVVVDSGKEKLASFHFSRNLPVLKTVNISKASSIQRAGRAGRINAGHCYRLWSEETQQRLVEHQPAQILVSEITGLLLEALLWGTRIDALPLLSQPSPAQIEHGYEVLQSIGAVSKDKELTVKGKEIANLGCHANLAKLLLDYSSIDSGCASLACVLVAILEGKPIVEMRASVVISQHVEYLLTHPYHPLWQDAKRWAKKISINIDFQQIRQQVHRSGELLAIGFPMKVAKKRGAGYLLSSGTGAELPHYNSEKQWQWIAVAKMSLQKESDVLIRLAEPISETCVLTSLKKAQTSSLESFWDQSKQKIVTRKRQYLGKILLSDQPCQTIESETHQDILLEEIVKKGLEQVDFPESAQQLIYRVQLARSLDRDDWPDFSIAHLTNTLSEWLSSYLIGVTSWQQLLKINWLNVLKSMLQWEQQKKLEQYFPTHLKLNSTDPVEKGHKLKYTADGRVVLGVKIQQIYGLKDTPKIANNRKPVQINMLSPANRSLHITENLTEFWSGSYREVQKEMKGRYPKHFWPDDPASAIPTNRTKKFM